MSPDEADGSDSSPGLDWYTSSRETIGQGDIIFEFPLILTASDGQGGYEVDSSGNYRFGMRTGNIVVLTQTCDMLKKAQKTVLVAEVHSYDVITANGQNSHLRETVYKQSLARGTAIQDFLLPPSPDGVLPWSIINFRNIHVVPKDLILHRAEAGRVLGIASPYREYLSQAFARFIMRVGLPVTLEAFEQYR